MPIVRQPQRRYQLVGLLVFWLVIVFLTLLNQQRIQDWWKLRGYAPSSAISSLVTDDTMTSYAEHLFYVNKPEITSGSSFTKNCSMGSEKTIILGCYKSADNGIYLYEVTDARLHGVVQVTAAHEMLHAAYARLSSSERNRVDTMLKSYYEHSLTDQRIKDTVEAYKQSEPTELYNEMHSVFGTEISSLPADLETYYAKYFTNRAKIIMYATSYESEFTSRRDRVANYDAQLKSLLQTIEANQASLTEQQAALVVQSELIKSLGTNGDVATYNAQVGSYNKAVNAYNSLRRETQAAIDSYNVMIDERNAIVLEEQQLTQSLSPQSLPAAQ
jgi:hypothetical protein